MNYIIKEIFSENESKVMSGKEIISLYPDMKEKLSFNDLFNVYPNGSIDMKKSGENCIPALNDESEIIDWIETVFTESLLSYKKEAIKDIKENIAANLEDTFEEDYLKDRQDPLMVIERLEWETWVNVVLEDRYSKIILDDEDWDKLEEFALSEIEKYREP